MTVSHASFAAALRDRSEFVILHEPAVMPLRFCPDGFFRVMAKAECRKCGRVKNMTVRCRRVRHDAKGQPVNVPDPNDEIVVTSLLLHATDHFVGCWNNAVPSFTKVGKCGINGHSTCKCGYVKQMHASLCPTAWVKRTGPMLLSGMTTRGRA